MKALGANGLSLSLGGALVLDAVSATFQPGQITAVLGPNGAGKSSLMACLAGLRRPDSGTVTLGGMARETIDRRALARQIGYLPQNRDVHWDVDVATLVALGRFPHQGRWGENAADRAATARAMAMTNSAHLAARAVGTLSGGEQARVLLARVLAGEPAWLLIDEPFASLDPAHQLAGLDCLCQVARAGAGVVVILHDLNQALRMADEVLLMAGGRVVAQGTPGKVLTPALIAQVYGVSVHIGTAPDGGAFLVPMSQSIAQV